MESLNPANSINSANKARNSINLSNLLASKVANELREHKEKFAKYGHCYMNMYTKNTSYFQSPTKDGLQDKLIPKQNNASIYNEVLETLFDFQE